MCRVSTSAPRSFTFGLTTTQQIRIWYCYVGKANRGSRQAKKVIRIRGEAEAARPPYRPNNPTYRVVHQRMAEALENGFNLGDRVRVRDFVADDDGDLPPMAT